MARRKLLSERIPVEVVEAVATGDEMPDGWTSLRHAYVDSWRWGEDWEVTVRRESDGRLFSATYRATTHGSDQGHHDYADEGGMVTAFVVKPVEVTVTQYHLVSEREAI